MTEKIITALIAAAVSLVVSLLTYIATRRKIESEKERQERELQRRLTEKLYDLRLDSYPKAFEITDKLRGDIIKGGEVKKEYISKVLDELHEWHRTKAGFLLTELSLKAFYNLRSSLSVEPSNDDLYSKKQRHEMWKCKNRFRGILKSDLNLLYQEESEPQFEEISNRQSRTNRLRGT